MTTAARTGSPQIAWRNALFAIFAISGLEVATWASRVPAVKSSLHVSTGVVGLMILGMSVGAILGLIASPPLSHRLGLRRGMISMLSVASLGLALIGIGTAAGSMPIAIAGLALLGFGNGSVDVMMNVSAADVERRIGKTTMPMMHAMFSIGTVIGAGIGAGAAALGIGILWHAVAMAVLGTAAVLVAVRFIPDRSADAATGETHNTQLPLRDRLLVWRDLSLVLIGVVMLGMAFAEGSANDWIAVASVDGHGQSQAGGAGILDVFVIAMTIGRMAGGPFVDRFGRVVAIRATAALGVIGLLLFITVDVPWVYIAGAALWGLGASLGFPLGMSAAADDERNATLRVSAVAMIGYCAFLAGPPLIGFLATHFGILHALYVILALLIAAFLCSGAVRARPHGGSDAVG